MHFWIDKRNPHIRCCHTTALGPRRRPPALLSWSFATSSVANSSSSSREARRNLRNQHRGRNQRQSSITRQQEESSVSPDSHRRGTNFLDTQRSISSEEAEDPQEGYQEFEQPPSYEEAVVRSQSGVQVISGVGDSMVTPVHRYQQVESFWEQGRRCSELASLRRNLSARRGRGHPNGPNRRHGAVPGTAVRAGSRAQTTDGYSYQDFSQHAAVIHAVRNGGAHVEIDTNSLLIEAGLIDARDVATANAVSQHQEYLLQQQRLQQSVARLVNEARLSGNAAKPLNCIIWTCFMALALFVVPAQMFYGNHTEFFFFFVVPLGLLVTGFCVAIKQYFFPKSETPHRHSPRPVTQTVLTADSSHGHRSHNNRMSPPLASSSSAQSSSTPPPAPTITEEDENGVSQTTNRPSSNQPTRRQINRHQQTTATVSSDAATSTQGSRTDIDDASSNHNNGPNWEHAMSEENGGRRRQQSSVRTRTARLPVISATTHSVSTTEVNQLRVELDGIPVAVGAEGTNTLSPLSDQVNDPPPYHLAILMPNPSSVAGTPMSTTSGSNIPVLPGVHLSNVVVDHSNRLTSAVDELTPRVENEAQGRCVAEIDEASSSNSTAVRNRTVVHRDILGSPPPPYEKSIGRDMNNGRRGVLDAAAHRIPATAVGVVVNSS